MESVSSEDAYVAMYKFLMARYERTKSEELAVLLGELSITPDGMPSDPASWSDWVSALDAAVAGKVDIKRRSPTGLAF